MIVKQALFRGGQWVKEATLSAACQGMDSSKTLVLAYASADLPIDTIRQVLAEIRGLLPLSTIVACSTAGEIMGSRVYLDSIVVGIIRFEHSRFIADSQPVAAPESSFDAGSALAAALAAPDLRAILIHSDGLGVNGSALAKGLVSGLNSKSGDATPPVTVSGGLAGDAARFQATWTYLSKPHQTDVSEIGPGNVVAIGFSGQRLAVSTGSVGGWDRFGHPKTITRSTGNVVYEIDGAPALDLYRRYLGELASELPASALLFPLELQNDGNQPTVVRTILSINEADKSLTFAGDVPEGRRAQLMRANFENIIGGAAQSGAQAIEALRQARGPLLAIAISCVGRRLVLGSRTEDETEALANKLPPGSWIQGFYSYGELSPVGTTGCELHNQTMTVTLLREN